MESGGVAKVLSVAVQVLKHMRKPSYIPDKNSASNMTFYMYVDTVVTNVRYTKILNMCESLM